MKDQEKRNQHKIKDKQEIVKNDHKLNYLYYKFDEYSI